MTIQSGKSLFLSSDEVVGFGGSGSGVGQVVKIYVPTLISVAETPTWAEVRWTKRLPVGKPIVMVPASLV